MQERNNSLVKYNRHTLKLAAQALREGKIVAFPTETVYGLGAIANNEAAIQEVFRVKGRPSDNPLIVHIASKDDVDLYVDSISPIQEQLMDHFWPGPLTIIFPVKEGVFAPSVTAGQKTVGLRMPSQLDTLLLIEMTGFPIVGPSANISTKPSSTTADHVIHDFAGKIQGVLLNPRPLTDIGVESTVVYAEKEQLTILRPGAITQEMLENVLTIPVLEQSAADQLTEGQVMSPGVKYPHYSPKQAVYMIEPDKTLAAWSELLTHSKLRVGIIAQSELIEGLSSHPNITATYSLGKKAEEVFINRHLYAALRYLEEEAIDVIYAQAFQDAPLTHAYMNRLSKAASGML